MAWNAWESISGWHDVIPQQWEVSPVPLRLTWERTSESLHLVCPVRFPLFQSVCICYNKQQPWSEWFLSSVSPFSKSWNPRTVLRVTNYNQWLNLASLSLPFMKHLYFSTNILPHWKWIEYPLLAVPSQAPLLLSPKPPIKLINTINSNTNELLSEVGSQLNMYALELRTNSYLSPRILVPWESLIFFSMWTSSSSSTFSTVSAPCWESQMPM